MPSFPAAMPALVLTMPRFWAVPMHADTEGREVARRLEASLATRPHVVVLSERPLKPCWYRYEGLALLLHSGGRYFLLPDRWRWGRDRVLLVERGPGVRFEFRV